MAHRGHLRFIFSDGALLNGADAVAGDSLLRARQVYDDSSTIRSSCRELPGDARRGLRVLLRELRGVLAGPGRNDEKQVTDYF